MNKREILHVIEENPIILGINQDSDLELAARNESQVVFTLFGSISDIKDTIHRLKEMKQLVFVNLDMVDGFSPRNSVVDFLKSAEPDGIISSKPSILRYAKEQGLFTIHRFFILDSSSWRNIGRQLEISQADIINITPGWTKVIQWTSERFSTPVISSGLVCDKEIVLENLNAGAIAICTTNHEVWNM
ncbi:MAG: glycerol-3-phosphate responsive antiterminator [Dorea sp.]|jgi:glycerol uptake operon antiterminator|nr:glycerol-3-phosphate responsive antiterminator [Dorea sp.]